MNSGELIITKAREWIGTPFHQQGRQKQIGCDCIGLILGVAQEVGAISLTKKPWRDCDVTTYDCMSDSTLLLRLLPLHFITATETEQGNILLFKLSSNNYHVGLYNENAIIHACSVIGKVVCHKIISGWQIMEVFKYSFQ